MKRIFIWLLVIIGSFLAFVVVLTVAVAIFDGGSTPTSSAASTAKSEHHLKHSRAKAPAVVGFTTQTALERRLVAHGFTFYGEHLDVSRAICQGLPQFAYKWPSGQPASDTVYHVFGCAVWLAYSNILYSSNMRLRMTSSHTYRVLSI